MFQENISNWVEWGGGGAERCGLFNLFNEKFTMYTSMVKTIQLNLTTKLFPSHLEVRLV